MPIGSRLTHTVTVVRDIDSGAEDDYGQPISTPTVVATPKAAIQSRSEQEQDVTSQAGASIADFTIFTLPIDVTTADSISHDPATCPMTDDLPELTFEIEGIRNAAGLGHHLEIEARAVNAPAEAVGS